MDKAGVICYIGVDGAATVIGLKSHNRERETRFSPPSLNRGKARSMWKWPRRPDGTMKDRSEFTDAERAAQEHWIDQRIDAEKMEAADDVSDADE